MKIFKKTDTKLKFMTEEREKSRPQLEQFGKKKKDASVKDLQNQLMDESRQSEINEDKTV